MPVFDSSWLIYLGAALLLVAYAIRDELKLRILIVISTFVYIAYYFLLPGGPLWDPIITSLLFVAINFWVLGQIAMERTTLRLSDDEKRLFEAFETLSPGQFRRVAAIAKWQRADDPSGTILTQEDEPSDALFYVFEGVISVEKRGRQFRLPEGNFVGEVAFVLNRRTTATTVAPQSVRYVEWDSEALRKLGRKHEALRISLNALLTRDLAKKLSSSYQPEDALPATPQSIELLEEAQS
ncbi:cyclic nucleotide-binding domain-containing protein [Erythrobacter sp. SCSIO 43205]|uniref:Crp/Fnr family transcriptional regulator n=1 Tax=Erythrobacter sp. SCSIO 43205 TaxID=2779361 RepID=UPI001CA7C39D|nr:cyclic nucleotide-binding domain-containing protein [Erythrobacter sp. SCSIO 43205]UAB78206.1 cyclic nucleotide-binding domain-containing protein [Erythrobacter sp. SCSIO 43205]